MALWTLERLERAVENFSAQLQCSICLCSYDNPVSLPCNHCFCEECIHRALELKALCPICKAPAKKRCLRYDTTVQELLRATEILCAAPSSDTCVAVSHKRSEMKNQVKHHVIAAPATKVAVAAKTATPETKLIPRRCAKTNSSKSSLSQSALPNEWVGGRAVRLKNGLKNGKEAPSTPVVTPARRRLLSQETKLKQEATQMSPALFEITMQSSGNVRTKDGKATKGELMHANATDRPMDENQHEQNQLVVCPRHRWSGTDACANTVNEAEEMHTAQSVAKREQDLLLSRRRKSDAEEEAIDIVVAETQSEVVEMVPHEVPKRRRRSASDFVISNSEKKALVSRQNKSDPDAVLDKGTNETKDEGAIADVHTSTPRKRRRLAKSGSVADASDTNVLVTRANPQPTHNGKLVPRNGTVKFSSLTTTSQEQPLNKVEVFQVGDLVDVIERQWVGINRRGGAGRITKVHGDGFYAVKFVIGSGTDNRVPGSFITRPAEDLISNSTPSHAVRKRQRQQSPHPMTSPDLLTATAITSSRSIDTQSIKSKSNSMANGKHLGLVFLCSGFKEERMRQIVKWAEILDAKVVHHWSNDVTHLIAKCVSREGEIDKEDPSIDDSSCDSSPQRQHGHKHKLFDDQRFGRWVKIRSLKYLKALVGGRWVVSDDWLRACADQGGHVSEEDYEADGHWKGRQIPDAVKRSRLAREKLLELASPQIDRFKIGTMLFADFCFHVTGEFLSPMPPIFELHSLISIGGGKLIVSIDDIPDEMQKRENRFRKLIIVSDKINPIALRQRTRQLKMQPQLKSVSSVVIVNYLWVINSISEAKLREFF